MSNLPVFAFEADLSLGSVGPAKPHKWIAKNDLGLAAAVTLLIL